MYSKWRGFCGILSLCASLALLGCGSTSNTNVRAVNASQGLTGNFTIQVGQTGIASSLPFGTEGVQPKGQYSTDDTSGNYRAVAAGANQPLVAYTTPGNKLVSTTQTFAANAYYTIVTLSPAPAIQLQTLTDDDTAPQSGDYKLRVMDTSTSAGAVDVYITALNAGPSGSPLVVNMQFQQVTPSYLQEPPGTLEVYVTPHGNTSMVLASKKFTPAAGKIYSVFFLDPPAAGATNYGVLIVNDPIETGTTM